MSNFLNDATNLDYDSSDNIIDNFLVERKRVKNQRKISKKNSGLKITNINPVTQNQRRAFNSYYNEQNLMLHGCAGTGKTFIACYLALQEVLNKKSDYDSIQLIRSIVPTRDIGFLPGNMKDKAKVYEAPYYAILSELFERGDAYDILKTKKVVNFETTSFIRGLTFDDSIIIVDECQNLTFHELDSVITRLGENSKIIFCGDFTQTDLNKRNEKSGIQDFMKVISRMKHFDSVDFNRDDIVRSDLVKDYICTKLDLGMS